MAEEVNIKEVVEEIRASDEENLQKVIEDWFSRTRTDGMRLGAKYISAAIFGIIQKHTKKPGKVSLNDYKRMTNDIIKIISVQLQSSETGDENIDSKNMIKENINDGTAEANNVTDS